MSDVPSAPPKVAPNDVSTFERYESNVRSYCRAFPTVFTRARGPFQYDEAGREYLDFFCGAGALNYGHNPEPIKRAVIDYLASDGVVHCLDMYATAKRAFIDRLQERVLRPRGLDYKVQFCGPTGTNAVEAALKLSRRVTGRVGVHAFTGGYHGLSLGSLAVTGNKGHRNAAGAPLPFGTFLPYPEGPYRMEDSLGFIEAQLSDANSGVDLPAAIIVEAVQAEGGIYVAPEAWLRGLRALCDRHRILLILDEVQTGCGRAGPFFAFERAGIVPDLVVLSKSISAYGSPMAVLLIKPELDVWKPADHTGTFRGFQPSFVAATAALDHYWSTPAFAAGILEREAQVRALLETHVRPLHPGISVRGAGLLWGVDLAKAGGDAVARRVTQRCFADGLIAERCGRDDTVVKLMPPLDIPPELLERGVKIIAAAIRAAL